ncbi:hypothetical protein YH65_06720 [Sulfurovum lithotrophicum]|uniref:DUF1343 domain-containing protein n=2 Tax=Sulfurovum lithotrophicum TaxID=206403 RepID=A0A7U4M340_9BACT|nr:hypothetical protein YH65_06720 [Sulfurovum lithotrophicum]
MGIYLLFSAVLFAGKITPAAERPELYLPLLKGKSIALVVNHASLIGRIHLVDYLLKHGIKIKKIFAPEHGFRGTADAGAHLGNSRDPRTGLPIISLYGKHKKPTKKDLKGIDLILFDIQDAGVRFYTYLSTLHYVMEAGAEQRIPVMVLDRPNPNGHYVDGPVLKKRYRSFVGLDPVPVVYGMTIGEYAKMLNGERWLKHGVQAKLTVIPLKNYTHDSFYSLPVKPSPNLPNDRAIMLYPSLAFFEGTVISAGRGTAKPFQLYGAPKYRVKKFSFIPKSRPGARYPKYKGKRCYGIDLSRVDIEKERRRKQLNLSYLRDAYVNYSDKKHFFLGNSFFNRLAGTDQLRKQIISGASEASIRKSWGKDLRKFRKIRTKYLLYP